MVADSGEGRWTALESIELGVPAPAIAAALMNRFSSQGRSDYAASACHDARALRRPSDREAAAGMIVLVMGVAGAGKTTIGEALARHSAGFIDADDYHPRRTSPR